MSVIINDLELAFNLHVSSLLPLLPDPVESLIKLGVQFFVHYAWFLNKLQQLRVGFHPLWKR